MIISNIQHYCTLLFPINHLAVYYRELNLEHISDKDYLHAQKVWDVFQIRNLGEYDDLYVQTDTLLLADGF